jgi:hypothetical protein
MTKKKTTPIRASEKPKSLIAMSAPVKVSAGASEGDKKSPATFEATFYTGGKLEIAGWDEPVVVDLSGLVNGNVLVANLDHKSNQRVGNFSVTNDGKSLVANGKATAATAARDEVVNSAADGYEWQASLEVAPKNIESVKSGETVKVNGQEFTGPLYVTRSGTLKGFAFVSHGADDNTNVTIAAIAASNGASKMKAEIKAWAIKMGVDVDNLDADQIATIEANYAGAHPEKPKRVGTLSDGIAAKQAEADRVNGITEIALNACDKRPYDITAIQDLANSAIEAKWTIDKFRLELLEASLPPAHTVFRTKQNDRLNNKILEAAICQAGRLTDYEKGFDDQTLQMAHDRFKGRIGLNQLFVLCAAANGYHGDYDSRVTLDVQRAAFGMNSPVPQMRQQHAAGFSTVNIANVLSNVANKFLSQGWNAVDMTPLRISKIRSVSDFKTITTVSLTGNLTFEKVGASGEIPHGELGDLTYTNKIDTYAKMLAITRQDYYNDDLGALTDVPKKLGRGSALKLNDIFWTEFLNNAGFFTSGNANVNTGVADATLGGLAATEVIFMSQTDPDGYPLGVQPKIWLVPTAIKPAALSLMTSQKIVDGTATAAQGDGNIWLNRYRVESSPYMSNATFTGYSAQATYTLADPEEMPVIEIAALNGRVEPIIETADAEFNVLGTAMRGYSDVGVNLQEYRGGVRADGGSS